MKNNSILKYGYLMKSLLLNEEEPIYGKYGMLRKQFLKEHRSAKYQYLLFEYSNAIVHAFQGFRAPFSGKIVHIFPEQSAAFN